MTDTKDENYKYPNMLKYLRPLINPGARKMVGREDIVNLVRATLNRYEISNVALVGEAGTGKTTVAQGVAEQDDNPSHIYFEVKLPLMASAEGNTDGSLQMATRLTRLIDEVIAYQKVTHKVVILFMDEFHLITELSPAAVESLKPILANSGSWGIRLIVATTFEEYNKYVRPNEALNERLERITLPELTFQETLAALRSYVNVHLPNVYIPDSLLRSIVTVTNQSLPSQKQPRKSLRLLDAMTGWFEVFKGNFDKKLFSHIMKASVGIDIDYQVDVNKLANYLNGRVFDQSLAVRAVCDRLNISVAGLNDPSRPRGSFLFTGSTGVGKTELAKAMANILFGSDSDMIRFDMSEYSKAESVDLLKRRLTDEVLNHPSSVILLDEIEKASNTCSKLMLQVLDDGRMTDVNGREVNFKDSYVIFTTNAGAGVFKDLQSMYGVSEKTSKDLMDDSAKELQQGELLRSYMPLIQNALTATNSTFPPELLGRFDQIVPFAPLNVDTRYKIYDIKRKQLCKTVLLKHGVTLHFSDQVARYVVEEHSGSQDAQNGGGREVNRKFSQTIVSKVAKVLNKHLNISDLAVVVYGTMALDIKNDNKGNARIAIEKYTGQI